MDQIREWQQNRESIKDVDAADVLKFICAEYTAISSEVEWDSEDDDVMKQQWEIIQMWRWSKANIRKIAERPQIPVATVRATIKKYKHKAMKLLSRNKAYSNKRRRLIDHEWVQRINAFCINNSHKFLTIDDIQNGLWTKEPQSVVSDQVENEKEAEEVIPAKSTIARALKRELKMSYKVVKLKHSKTQTVENKRGYLESVLLHKRLILSKYEMIYIDEFAFFETKLSTHTSYLVAFLLLFPILANFLISKMPFLL